MASESPTATQIRTALSQHLKRDVIKIRPGDRLREDLGLDSLAMIELLFKIEEHFDLEIPNEDLSRITTVAHVTAYVEDKLGERPVEARAPASPPATAPAAMRSPAVKAAARGAPAAKDGPAGRRPAVVTPIKAAAKRKAAGAATKPGPAKKKGSRRA